MSVPTENAVRDFLDSFIDNEADDPVLNVAIIIYHIGQIMLHAGLLDDDRKEA